MISVARLVLLLSICLCFPVASFGQDSRGGQVFNASFKKQGEFKLLDRWLQPRWSRRIKDSTGNTVLRVRTSNQKTRLLRHALPMSVVAGRKIVISLRLRVTAMEDYAYPFNGAKVALHISSPAGEAFPQLQIPHGTVDWQRTAFTAVVPQNASSCTLLLGIESAHGEVFYDDISIRVLPLEPRAAQPPSAFGPDSLEILRGAMISTFASRGDLEALAALGANHIRWQLTWDGFPDSPADTATLDAYKAWLNGALTHVQSLMPLCDSLGLEVVLDLHSLPGGRDRQSAGQAQRIFTDAGARDAFKSIWMGIASRFKNIPGLWGYDLANEPLEGLGADSLQSWQQLAEAVAAGIHEIDSARHIIIEGAPNGSADALPGLQVLPHVIPAIYSFHMYEPALFTHQGLYGLDTGIRYPGMLAGRLWNKEALRAVMQPVREWQLLHRATIYVGEFSAARWAPDSSAYRYVRDCIDIFEEWGWSWAYHAFRESEVWSVEHDGNRNNKEAVSYPTDRKLLLIEAFRKNKKLPSE